MLLGRTAAPLPDLGLPSQFALEWKRAARALVVVAPPGSLHVGRFSADLTAGGPTSWLRLAPYEVDSFAVAPWAGTNAAEGSAAEPMPQGGVLVVDLSSHRSAASPVRALSYISGLPQTNPVVLLTPEPVEQRMPGVSVVGPACLSPRAVCRSGAAMRLDRHALRRLWTLTHGRAAAVNSVLETVPVLGHTHVSMVLRRSCRPELLLTRLAADMMSELGPGARAALGLAARLGYCHESLPTLLPALECAGTQPWWVPLVGGWYHIDPMWRAPLLEAAARDEPIPCESVDCVLSELLQEQALEDAIELCIDLGEKERATNLLAEMVGDLVRSGRHETLARWLRRLAALAPVKGRGPQRLAVQDAGRPVPAADARPTSKPGEESDDGARTMAVEISAPVETPPDAVVDPGSAAGGDLLAEPVEHIRDHAHISRPSRPTLLCRLLGRFEVVVDGRPVTRWKGSRGRVLLAYLVLHRSYPLGREALAAALWPDATSEAAGNRLHVTLHGLRRDLRSVSDEPIVVFRGGYGMNPELMVDVDVERFDDAVGRARRSESADDPGCAASSYAEAARLYRGDLLDDAPYEEWTLLPREQYRVRFLHALDRLAHLRFDAGDYHECIEACERLLAADSFREDIHRMLMRSYARISQPHLALRQFDTCVAQLRTELNVDPDEETLQLVDCIRRRVGC